MAFVFFTGIGSAYAQLGFFMDKDQDQVKIPIDIYNNLIIGSVELQNTVPLRFIFDSGVRNTIITEKSITDLLGLEYVRKYTIRGVGGDHIIEAFVVNDVSIGIEGIKGRGHSVLVLKEDYIDLSSFLGTPVHGMVGYELFSRFIVEIRYNRNFVRMHRAESFKPGRRYTAVPISIEDTKPYVHAPVVFKNGNQHTLKLLIDTGASHGLMLDPYSDEKVTVPEKTIDANIGQGLGGKIEGEIGRISTFHLGDYQLEDVVVRFPYEGSYTDSLNASKVFRHGSIGGEVLSRFNIIFDYSKEIMYIRRNSSFNDEFYYNLSGMTVKAKGAKFNEFFVEEVRKSSDAYAQGIRENDELIQINGLDTDEMTLPVLNSFFNRKPGRRVSLTILRGEKEIRYKFLLESAI